jgi:hypothetical protein
MLLITAISLVSKLTYNLVTEHQEYKRLKEINNNLIIDYQTTVTQINTLNNGFHYLNKRIDSLSNKGREYFAVGFRSDKEGNKFYRDWDGKVYPIYLDLFLSNTSQNYYYYIKQNGQRIYCFAE